VVIDDSSVLESLRFGCARAAEGWERGGAKGCNADVEALRASTTLLQHTGGGAWPGCAGPCSAPGFYERDVGVKRRLAVNSE